MATSILDLTPERAAEACAEPEDLRLVDALRGGSERAYEELITRFQQPAYTLALRLLNDQAEASDVVQEVFLKVFRGVNSFRGQSSLRTWVYRIAVNEAYNHRRWFARHSRHEVPMESHKEEWGSSLDMAADPGRSNHMSEVL